MREQCYALVGLRALDMKLFEAEVVAFEQKRTPVNTIGGCIVATLPMNSVVANIRAGHYDAYTTCSQEALSRREADQTVRVQ